MADTKDKTFKESQAAAYRLLKIRNRSEKEIRDKLMKKDFSADVIEQTVQYLKTAGFIDDRLFTKGWISSRLNKPFGKRRIEHELKQKGVTDEILKEELGKALETFDENEAAAQLALKRTAHSKTVEKEKLKQRIFNYLLRRGFSISATQKAIKIL
ncbi:MAG: regulatory protein RecX [Candidatus Omnitrophica bacterium]|nr:regulatory protein RecX [Candidatus Omnitrophota bacterium]